MIGCDCERNCFGLPSRPSRCGACGGAGCGVARYAGPQQPSQLSSAPAHGGMMWLLIGVAALLLIGGNKRR